MPSRHPYPSSFIQFVFKEEEFSKPFFVTYLSTSTFAFHLLIVAGRALVQRCRRQPSTTTTTTTAPRHPAGQEDGRPLLLDDNDAFALGDDDDDDDHERERDDVFGDRKGRSSDPNTDGGVDGTSFAAIQLDALPAKPRTASPPSVGASTSSSTPATPAAASAPDATDTTHFTLRQVRPDGRDAANAGVLIANHTPCHWSADGRQCGCRCSFAFCGSWQTSSATRRFSTRPSPVLRS